MLTVLYPVFDYADFDHEAHKLNSAASRTYQHRTIGIRAINVFSRLLKKMTEPDYFYSKIGQNL